MSDDAWTTDAIREAEKLLDVLEDVTEYLETVSEANAKLHGSERVMYSPLAARCRLVLENGKRFWDV